MFNRQSNQVLAASGRPTHEENNDQDDDTSSDDEQEIKKSGSCNDCGASSKKRKGRSKKPDQLRKELYELLLRKRVFLTDRLEKIEKMLLLYGIVTESQIGNQAAEMLTKVAQSDFESKLGAQLDSTDYKSSE